MKNKFSIAMSLAMIVAMLVTSFALASDVDVAVVDVIVPATGVTLAPGASGNITINMVVTGNQVGTATFEVYRDWVLTGGIFTGSNPQEFTVAPRAGGDPATAFSTSGTVTVAAGHASGGPFTLTVGVFDITNSNKDGAKLSAGDFDTYQVTVSAPPPPADTTAPIITKIITGTAGANGWYTSDVTVAWSVSDAQSAVVIDSGCGTQSFTSETMGTPSSCSAHSAGGPASESVTIKIDKTGPSAALAVTAGTAGLNGWYTSDVTVSTSGSDSISSPVTCTAIQSQTTETAGAVFNGSCTNDAGLTTYAAPLTIKLDKTAPTISAAATTSPNGVGWYNSDVTVQFTCSDAGSGIPTGACPSNQVLSTEGTGISSTAQTVTDVAGNTSIPSNVVTVNIDKTKPTISAAVSAGTLGLNGWYVSNVTVQFTCTDGLSGIPSGACPADQVLSAEGAAVASTVQTVTDAAGNISDPSNVVTVSIDKTAPSTTITAPANGASFLLNQAVAANYSCSDATSGIATCAGPVANGANTDTASTGSKSFTVNASDAAGNINSAVNSYTVAFKMCVLYDQTKSHKSGSTVPVKLQLCDVNGVNYSSASIVVKATNLTKLDSTAGALDDSGAANSPDMNFRYDATLGGSGGYIFNLSTKGLTTGTWKLAFTVNGATDTSYFVKFDVK